MRTIFKKSINDESEAKFIQKFVPDGKEIPEGWTEDFDELGIPEEEPSETELMKQQIADMQEIISETLGGGAK